MNAPMSTPAKWNLYPYGDNVLRNHPMPDHKELLPNIDVVIAPSTYIEMIKNGSQ